MILLYDIITIIHLIIWNESLYIDVYRVYNIYIYMHIHFIHKMYIECIYIEYIYIEREYIEREYI